MKLSVLANLYGTKSLDETLAILSGLGVHTVEIGAGGYPGKAHCNPEELLADSKKFDEFVATFKKYDVEICALAAHGNALHPDKAIAEQFVTQVNALVTEFLSSNPDKKEDVKKFVSQYAKGGDYFKITESTLAAKLLEDFKEKFVKGA